MDGIEVWMDGWMYIERWRDDGEMRWMIEGMHNEEINGKIRWGCNDMIMI
jgi:hypothetical protein